jgi:hypothetical protein
MLAINRLRVAARQCITAHVLGDVGHTPAGLVHAALRRTDSHHYSTRTTQLRSNRIAHTGSSTARTDGAELGRARLKGVPKLRPKHTWIDADIDTDI